MNVVMQLVRFLQEVKVEMGRVQWPKLNEFLGATAVTLLVVLFFMVYIGFVDRGISLVVNQIFAYGS